MFNHVANQFGIEPSPSNLKRIEKAQEMVRLTKLCIGVPNTVGTK